MTLLSDILVLTPPEGEGEDVPEIRWSREEEGYEEVSDFGEGQGDERWRLSLKEVREEVVEIGGPLFLRSSRGSRP